MRKLRNLRFLTFGAFGSTHSIILAGLVLVMIGFAAIYGGAGTTASTPVTPPRGVPGDSWADVIIGQPDFTEISPGEVVPDKLQLTWGGGVIVDRSVSPGRLYVWDGGNNRILGVDLATCYATSPSVPCSADLVIGQPSDTDSSACNGDSGFQSFPKEPPASELSLCGLPSHALSPSEEGSIANMFVDSSGNLYVPDTLNHRVLKYDSPFTSGAGGTHNTEADEVWGQADFTGNECNRGGSPNATTLCFDISVANLNLPKGILSIGGGVAEDPDGNIWIADSGNARVLRFPKVGGVVSKTADVVLGQGSFTSRTMGSNFNQMDTPVAIRFDKDRNLYVADADGDGSNDPDQSFPDGTGRRILYFEYGFSPPATPYFPYADIFGSDMCPRGLEIDDYSGSDTNRGGLWVQDICNSRVLLWDVDTETVKKLIGKYDIEDLGSCTGNGTICWNVGSIGIDDDGNILVSDGRSHNDVLRFDDPLPDLPSPGPGSPPAPDLRLFTDGGSEGPNQVGAKGLVSAVPGLAVVAGTDPATSQPFKQMIVSDARRLLFWNDADNLTDYQAATGVIIPCDEPCTHDFDQFSPWNLTQVKSDGTQLWVGVNKSTVRKEMWVYDLPLHTGDQPSDELILGSAGSGYEIPAISAPPGGELALKSGEPQVLFEPIDGGDFVWLSFPGTNKAVRIRDPLDRDPLVTRGVDVILGQDDLTGTACNGSADGLCRPGHIAIDGSGNLYVSDHWLENGGNDRLLKFDAALFPPSGPTVITSPDASKIFPAQKAWGPAFDSCGRMVVGYNAFGPDSDQTRLVWRQPRVYNDPNGPSTVADAVLEDFYSHPYQAVFDESDNLYLTDLNRSRIMIYKQPFDSCVGRVENFTVNAVDADEITMSWNADLGSSTYELCVALSYNPGGAWLCGPETTATKYNGDAPTTGSKATLYYAVRGISTEGMKGQFSNRAVVTVFDETLGTDPFGSYFTVYKDSSATPTKMVNGFNRLTSDHWFAYSNFVSPSLDVKSEVPANSIWFNLGPQSWTAPDWLSPFGPLIRVLDYVSEPPASSDNAFLSTLCMEIFQACE